MLDGVEMKIFNERMVIPIPPRPVPLRTPIPVLNIFQVLRLIQRSGVVPVPPRLLRPGQNIIILTPRRKYELLKCKFCGELVMNPVQSCPTGHRHCELCFRRSVLIRERCPTCTEEGIRPEDDCVLMGAIFYDKGAKYDIDKLEVQCVACGYKSTMRKMESHEHIA